MLHPEAARKRRSYVLRRMREDGAITEEQRRAADESPVQVHAIDDPFREVAPFYAEAVRRRVVERHGNPRVLREGLRVEAAMDLDEQRAAQQAMLHGLLEVDRRQGYWGPVARVEGAEREALRQRLARAWPAGSLRPGDFAVGIVSSVNDGSGQVKVEVGAEQGLLPISGMRWARTPNPQVHWEYAMIQRPSAALRAGDVVLVRRVLREELAAMEKQTKSGKPADVPDAPLLLALEQEPRLQGALVAQDPGTGYVEAMVGGYDFEASEFNRAFQACRQPGSAFKPILYAAAIEKLSFTPSTLLTDAPVVFRDSERSWKPQNFGEDFKGEVPLRSAVISSMNIPAVKTAEMLARKLGPGFLGEWAASLGITSPVKPELGSALGKLLRDPLRHGGRLRRARPAGAEAAGRAGEAGARSGGAAPRGPDRARGPVGAALRAPRRGLRRGAGGAGAGGRPAGGLHPPAPHARGGHGGHRRAGGEAGEAGRREDRDHQRLLRHLVPGLHRRPGGGGLARLRPQRAAARARRDRWPGGAAHLARLHAGGAARPAPARLPRPGGDRLRPHRPEDRGGGGPVRGRACSSPTWRGPSRPRAPRARPAPPRSTCTTCSAQ